MAAIYNSVLLVIETLTGTISSCTKAYAPSAAVPPMVHSLKTGPVHLAKKGDLQDAESKKCTPIVYVQKSLCVSAQREVTAMLLHEAGGEMCACTHTARVV